MAFKNKRIMIGAIIVFLILTLTISYRIYTNLAANKDRADKATQGRAVAVETAVVTRRDITPTLLFSANLEPVWSADISSKVDGRIDRLVVEEGDGVKAGDIVATLDTNELAAQVIQAEGNLLTAQAGLEQAELDLRRNDALAKQGAVSLQTLDTMRIKRDLALGQLRSAEGNMSLLTARLENANITAPRNGVVIKRFVQSGYYTKSGSAIVTLADTSSLLAKATVGEAQMQDIIIGSTVKVLVSALGNKEFSGVITRLSPAAASPSRTFTAEITIPNPQGELKPGIFANVSTPVQARKNVIAVPESALVMKEDQKTVFVVNAQGVAQQSVLKLGYVGEGYAEVLAGLQEGDVIITAGHNKVKDGSVIAGAKAGAK
ncbi:efflux RND transporter periplasmic adaptor subunit [Anaerospora sp.]|uniref:efflux RND transporter periplasmic adaptor subunit n=1 Tax=Anaerospora sp. TaxID=1960278 RepID=UPI00289A00B3|nr:efflux RND transporter periplasmic adaptor subunit [Anaerospora sp.]MDF2928499.1 efflux transporter, family, subunit [Anaerospora sp.]